MKIDRIPNFLKYPKFVRETRRAIQKIKNKNNNGPKRPWGHFGAQGPSITPDPPVHGMRSSPSTVNHNTKWTVPSNTQHQITILGFSYMFTVETTSSPPQIANWPTGGPDCQKYFPKDPLLGRLNLYVNLYAGKACVVSAAKDICSLSRQDICGLPRHPNSIANRAALRPSSQRRWKVLGDHRCLVC